MRRCRGLLRAAAGGENKVGYPACRRPTSFAELRVLDQSGMSYGWIGIPSSFLSEHDLFEKPVSTFPDHALGVHTTVRWPRLAPARASNRTTQIGRCGYRE
jgi:hypothetical protein